MCVAALAWQAHPRWLLVAIGNRDEFHDRPAAPLARWRGPGGIIAGRDLKSGGTWLGVSQAGRFGLVTNLRGHGGPDPDKASRGALVTDQLTGTGAYADPETAKIMDFNPFNLIVANSHEARFLSNRPHEIRTALAHGIYGLSNGTLDEPWPKTLQLKAALLDWLTAGEHDFERLFEALASEALPDIGVHPDRPSDIPQEADDTPVFIRNPVYGTRCSTVVAIGQDGSGWIGEKRFAPDGGFAGESAFAFEWSM
jgi:uncharacterized protein with NRDE domain